MRTISGTIARTDLSSCTLAQLGHREFIRWFRAGCAPRNFIIFELRFLYGYRHQEIARIKALGLRS